MELKDTIDKMTSDNYRERFKAEYYQTQIRQNKLMDMCIKYKAGTLHFVPRCSYDLLLEQVRIMGQYLLLLRVRAEIEGIDL